MKHIILLLLSFSRLIYSQDNLIFNFNEQWTGNISTVQKDIINLKSPLSKEDLKFKLDKLKAIEFGGTKPLKGSHKVTMINSDGFTGELLELNSEFLVLKTLCSGLMQIPRKYISIIEPFEKTQLPLGSNDNWKLTQSLRKDVECKEPIIINIAVDLSEANNFSLVLTKANKDNSDRFYFTTSISTGGTLVINGKKQELSNNTLKVSGSGSNGTQRLVIEKKPLEKGIRFVDLKIFFNPQESFFAIIANDVEVGKIKLHSKLDIEKLALYLRPLRGTPYLNKLNVEKWDGHYNSYVMTDKIEKYDNILLVNGDMASGKITDIKNQQLTFSTNLGDHQINLALVSRLFLKNVKSQPVNNNYLLSLNNSQTPIIVLLKAKS